MTKTKSKNIIVLLVVALLTPSTTSFAAVYDWIGIFDGDWDNRDNWNVTGSIWTWPNEQYFTIANEWVNDDCEEINITSGNKVSRFYGLAMSGASEGSNEIVLTISNNSDLNIWGRSMWIGQSGDGTAKTEVSNGSSLTVHSLVVGNAEGSTGLLDVINGAVEVYEMYVGKYDNSTGKLQIRRDVPSDGYDLTVAKDMTVGFKNDSVGTVEIKSSTVVIGHTLWVAKDSTGMFEIEDSILDIWGNMQVAGANSSATVEIKSSTVRIGKLFVGRGSTGMFEIEDSVLEIDSKLEVGRNSGSIGTVEIKDSTLDIKHHLILTREGTSIMNIEGNSKISVNEQFRMGYADTLNSLSELKMDGGDVFIASHSRLNAKGGAGSVANFTLNDGKWTNGGEIYVGETPKGDCNLTINGGTMVSYNKIFVGSPGIDDSGQSRIFLNGGLLQGEGLEFNINADSRIVYKGGELWINKSVLTETDMQNLIDIGKIDVSAAPAYEITTVGDYTVLRPL